MGSVPIYWGAQDIDAVLPAHEAAIHMADFRSEHELAAYVRKAMTDPQVYQRHLAWKKQPIPPHVEREVQEQMGNVYCRLCDHVRGGAAGRTELR